MRLAIPLILAIMWAYAPIAYSVKLYKWIDEAGNVTYQDHPPPSGRGAVEEKNIDPDQNALKFVIPETTATPADHEQTVTEEQDQNARGNDDAEDRGSRSSEPTRFAPALAGGASTGGSNGSAGTGVAATPPPPAPPAPPPSVPAGTGGGF